MQEIELSADALIRALLGIASKVPVSILDSCGVGRPNSHLLIAGIRPSRSDQIFDLQTAVERVDEIALSNKPVIFTLSYEFGRLIQNVKTRHETTDEPLAHIAEFDNLILHNYDNGKSFVLGEESNYPNIINELKLASFAPNERPIADPIKSNFSKIEYITAIEQIKEQIRRGYTYQTNLTRSITAVIPPDLSPESIFWRLRKNHPAPFSAFIKRPDSTVVSASPERFFKLNGGKLTASPIKGTRPRGTSPENDAVLRRQLDSSEKERAENIMIVDLLRNDLGRICNFGSVTVDDLCKVEEHPSLFHLVSTVSGLVSEGVAFSVMLAALFPCGSITGAPKISTMKIIDEIEPSPRGLSMGGIGYRVPGSYGIGETMDLSVAIRTMVIKDGVASFNVGGGIVIDSEPENEWDETCIKSLALVNALGLVNLAGR